MRNTLRVLLAGVAIASVVGCGDDIKIVQPDISSVAVSVSPQSQTIAKGQSFTAVANVSGGPAGTVTTVTWASSNNAVATVSASGVVTGVAAGVATITATSAANAAKVGAVVVTVIDAAPGSIRALQVTPSAVTVGVNGTADLVATGTCDAGVANCSSVTYASSNTAIATVDATGRVTGKAIGQTTVTATSAVNTNVRVAVPVTVTAANLGVRGISVTPSTVALATAGTATIVSNVTADAGVSRNVTCTSATPAVATVVASGSNCTITGVTNGTAVITVSSTVDPSFSQQVAVTVRDPLRATVSIRSITVGNLNTPVNPAAVAGQIDITLNLDAGDERISRVDLVVHNNATNKDTVLSQTFSAALADAYRAAVLGASADVQPLVFSLNTAAFGPAGIPNTPNATYTVTAKVYTGASGAAAQQSAQTTTTLTLANVDNTNFAGITTTLVGTQTQKTALDQNGLVWNGGSVTITLNPVIYSGSPLTSITLSAPGTTGTVQGIAGGTCTYSITATTFPATVTFVATPATAATPCTLNGVTNGNFVVTVANALSGGNNLNSIINNTSQTATPFRLDNRAPDAGVYSGISTSNALSTQNTANGFIGSSFVFPGANSASLGYAINANVDNGGVDRQTVRFEVAPAGTTAWQAITSGTAIGQQVGGTIAATQTNLALILRQIECDALGNCRTTGTSGTPVVTFGIDLQAPTAVAYSNAGANVTSNEVFTATAPGQSFALSAQDDISGFSTTPVLATLTRDFPGLTAAQKCVIGNFAGGVCSPVSTTFANLVDNGAGTQGYFTYTVTSICDQAGNCTAPTNGGATAPGTSAATQRQALIDATAPISGGIATPASLTGGAAAAFSTSATDNIDLVTARLAVTYAGPAFTIRYPNQALGAAFDGTLTTASTFSYNVPFLIRNLEQTTAGNAPPTGATVNKPTNVLGSVVDAAGNLSTVQTAPIQAATIATTGTYFGAAFTSFALTSSQANVSVPPFGTGVTPVNPQVTTLTAQVLGPAGTLPNPFINVGFYANIGGELVQIATATGSVTDNGPGGTPANTRIYTYAATFNPGTAGIVTPGALQLFAIGVNAAGDALISQPISITLTNP